MTSGQESASLYMHEFTSQKGKHRRCGVHLHQVIFGRECLATEKSGFE